MTGDVKMIGKMAYMCVNDKGTLENIDWWSSVPWWRQCIFLIVHHFKPKDIYDVRNYGRSFKRLRGFRK